MSEDLPTPVINFNVSQLRVWDIEAQPNVAAFYLGSEIVIKVGDYDEDPVVIVEVHSGKVVPKPGCEESEFIGDNEIKKYFTTAPWGRKMYHDQEEKHNDDHCDYSVSTILFPLENIDFVINTLIALKQVMKGKEVI